MIITTDILKTIAPGGHQTGFKLFDELAAQMNHYFPSAGIDQNGEYCHFLAQAAHETNSFNTLTEYDSGMEYEGRKDLGNIAQGWGVRYKGRGIFQTTGYTNYQHLTNVCPESISFLNAPELLATPKWAVWSALIFWNDKHLSDIANMPDDKLTYSKYLNKWLSPVEYISFRVNGGLNGIDHRKEFYERAKKIFV